MHKPVEQHNNNATYRSWATRHYYCKIHFWPESHQKHRSAIHHSPVGTQADSWGGCIGISKSLSVNSIDSTK